MTVSFDGLSVDNPHAFGAWRERVHNLICRWSTHIALWILSRDGWGARYVEDDGWVLDYHKKVSR